MFNLVKFNPMHEIDQILSDSFCGTPRLRNIWGETYDCQVNIYNTQDELIVHVVAPGISKDDIKLVTTKDSLAITGEFKAPAVPEGATIIHEEHVPGKFQRTFKLPVQIQPEKVTALSQNGLLEIHLPKAEENKPYDVKIE